MQVLDGFVLTIPDFDGFDAASDILAVCADVLHHGRTNGAGNTRQPLNALKTQPHAVIDEIVPIAPGFGVYMHCAVVAFDWSGLVRNGDRTARVANHDAMERLIGYQHIGPTADDEQRQSLGIGLFHGLDDADTGGGLYETIDLAADGDGSDVCKRSHGCQHTKRPDQWSGLQSIGCSASLAVHGLLAAASAELLQFKAIRSVTTILGRNVITLLALGACQRDAGTDVGALSHVHSPL